LIKHLLNIRWRAPRIALTGGSSVEAKAKLLGHPVHPMLIVFPLGLLATAVAFDIVALAQSDTSWYRIAFWMIAAGIIGGLCAAVFGVIDWFFIPAGTRAKRIGLLHGGTNVVVVLLFIASWWMRELSGQIPSNGALALSFIAVALALIGGWLGGELVDRLGVGVDSNANVNAPSSLSKTTVTESRPDYPLRKAS
jgi:uncharacterized membrane protein